MVEQAVVEVTEEVVEALLVWRFVAGIGAARVATSHYSLIVKSSAQMMIAGPALVDWANLGEVSKEELGASKIHTRNGAIDDEVATIKLESLGGKLETLTDEQVAYLSGWQEGTS